MRKAGFAGPIGLLLTTLALTACKEAKQPAPDTRPLVRVSKVEMQPFHRSVSLTGEVAARIQSDIAFRVSGRMTERLVDVGTHVAKDQLLAKIDPTQQEADVRAATASVASAEAQLKQSQAAFERQKTLLTDGFTTRRDYDLAERALTVAIANLEAAKAQQVIAVNALSYTELRADDAGIITARNIDVGEVAQAAQIAFTLAKDGPRDAVFEVNESLLLTGDAGSVTIAVTLVRAPQIKAQGTIRQVSPTVNPRTGTVRVKIGLENPPPEMTLGSVVSGTGSMPPVPAMSLPWTALSSLEGNPAVWIYDPQTQKIALNRVKVEEHQTGRVIVSSGIKNGDMVVADGTKLLQPNQQVEIAKDIAP